MRNFILLLLVAFALPVAAQKSNSVTFDFANPTSLDPQITPSDVNSGTVSVTDKVFHNDLIDISFAKGILPIGAYIETRLVNSAKTYSLNISQSTIMRFSAKYGVTIDKIQFSDDCYVGDLGLADNEPGYLDAKKGNKLWTNNTSNSVNSVTFVNNYRTSKLKKITVTYTSQTNILLPSASSISNGQSLNSFQGMELTFDGDMSVVTGANATLSNGTDVTNLAIEASGTKINLTPSSPIVAPGTYTLKVPAGSLANRTGYMNKELIYTFIISDFHTVSASPAFGVVTSIPNTFTVTFSDVVGKVEHTPLVLVKDGTKNLREVYMSHPDEGSNDVVFTISNNTTPFTEKGVYTIDVPANVIYNSFPEIPALRKTNSAFTVRYEIVDDTPVPPTPEESATMKKAKELLKVSGIGYPTATSPARTALADLVNSETMPTDEEVQAAIDAFYAETVITLPDNDKYYRIEGVAANGHKLYLEYKDNAVGVTDKIDNASAFKAIINANGTMSFQTTDKKYLHVLTALNNYDETSKSNVTDSYLAKVNDLQVLKLNVSGVDADKQFGLMSIYGCLGKEKQTGNDDSTFVMLDHSDASIPTLKFSDPAFTNTLSSAFKVVEVKRPAETIPAESVACTISPDYVNTTSNVITIQFTDNTKKITLTKNVSATIAGNGKSYQAKVEALAGQNNTFCIHTDGLEKGSYTLTIKEGSFAFKRDDLDINIVELKKNFNVDEFNVTNLLYGVNIDNLEPIFDTDLNNIVLTVLKGGVMSGLEPDVKKVVRIAPYFNPDNTIRTGHFEKCSDVSENVYGIKLVLDKPITKGEIASSQYRIFIDQATFGDANFGKYVNGDKNVKPSDCKVNSPINITYKVDNNLAVLSKETAYTLTPDVAESTDDKLTLKFTDVKELTLASNAKAYFTGKHDAKVADAKIEADKTNKNVFTIALTPLKEIGNGDYELVIEDGAFLYTKDGRDVKTTAISAAFSIGKNGSADDERISFTEKNFTVAPASSATDFIKDVELNSITLTAAEGTKLAVNKARKATLYSPKNEVVATGVFENVDKAAGSAIRFVMDKQIEAGKLEAGTYSLKIQKGTFGNENFLKFLADKTTVKAEDCVANPDTTLVFYVDNVKAIKTTETKYELLPAVAGQKDNTLTLSFPEVKTLTLVADAKAQFTAADGTKAGDAKLVADAEKKNVFTVSIEGLADGAYTLAISEGAFHYTLNDREVKTQAINAKFSVDKAVKVTETKFELLPAVAGQKDNTLTLSFPEVETLSLVADAKAQFTAADGTKAGDAKLVADAEKKNVFTVSIEGLADGAYTLAISEGAFHYTLNDREVKTQAINAAFTVDKAVKTVETKYELTPEVAESTDDHLTLTFPEVDAMTVADGVTAQFNDAEGNKVADATFAADGEKKNQFTIALSQLDTEDYTLVIPEGAFIYTKDEIKVKTQAISYSFTIGKNGSADDERISFNYAGYTVKPESSTKEYLHDEELNNITVVAANDMTIAANTEREATLVSVVDPTVVVAKGHFEVVETAEGENATLRLVLDTPIVKGSLDAGVYMLQIAQGTFGNEEFGKFLADKKSVKAEDCVANAKTSILFYVDNTWTSINGIHADGTADGDIYTLQGVKVQKMTTPGVYIVNGKKIVKK